jgi:hypothetical protein
MSPERTSVYDDHFSIVALSRYHFATHHHSVDCRDFLPAYDRTVFTTKNLRLLLRRRSQPGTTLRASTVRPSYKAPQLGSQALTLRPPYPVSPLLFQFRCLSIMAAKKVDPASIVSCATFPDAQEAFNLLIEGSGTDAPLTACMLRLHFVTLEAYQAHNAKAVGMVYAPSSLKPSLPQSCGNQKMI